MKNFYYLFIALLILTSGCKKKFVAGTEAKDFTINSPQTIGATTFTVTAIEDNRCPINAFCAVAGKALVSLTTKTGLQTKSESLCIGYDCKTAGISERVQFKVADINYTVKLIEVTPFNDLTDQAKKLGINLMHKF
ncbi:hypothetical protein [Pedobacter jamesrossensis]|uniref:Lipoprotein n=1 Tax=Pedobacter jamesrossensis TaxID=1908238 RepID=A0ABV8NJU5_9SPHI